ncbi:MAG: ParB N-terminal domain-containing protein [Planctomycetes bacterium]|nr:ParB N-terminal domain-containing protein [Planctomycetota bacterium]
MNITNMPIDAISPYPKNPRKNDQAIDTVAASIEQFGFQQPIVVDNDHVIVIGHTRFKAAQQLGMSEVPVQVAKDLSPEQIQALRIADNKTGELATWDLELLPIEMSELSDAGFDMDLFGFDAKELSQLLQGDLSTGLTDPDEVPENAPTKCQLGDLWQLGSHKLFCGDATSTVSLDMLLDNELVSLLLTDPPYNVAYQGKTKEQLTIDNDAMSADDYKLFLKHIFKAAHDHMAEGASFYIWHADSWGQIVRSACEDVGLKIRQCLIWKKNSLVLGRQDYHWIHEPCLYGWKEGAAHTWMSDRSQTTILEFDRPSRSTEHPTMKPISLMAYQILNNTFPDGLVLDVFGGSGSTLIACEQTGRRARLTEIDPHYCDVIIARYEQFSGVTAMRIGHSTGGALCN